jgi:predicted extracellular nuclease
VNLQELKIVEYTIAFYNLENLFDIRNDKTKYDSDFLPGSDKRWTKKRYERKLYKLGQVISKIGLDTTKKPPAIVGLAEVQNKDVIQDLIASKELESYDFGYVHYDSKDERGIDVALLYDKTVFTVEDSKTYTINLKDDNGEQDYTRDILLVSGMFYFERVHVIVNHWPSRGEGELESKPKRIKAAQKVIEIINYVKGIHLNPKILVMGDFNDNPNNESIKLLSKYGELYNPMETLLSYSRGSVSYRFKWNLFDQILFSTNFFETETNKLKFDEANIFDETFLKQNKGRYKGQPFRTYEGAKYKGGFSDHFPVYVKLYITKP